MFLLGLSDIVALCNLHLLLYDKVPNISSAFLHFLGSLHISPNYFPSMRAIFFLFSVIFVHFSATIVFISRIIHLLFRFLFFRLCIFILIVQLLIIFFSLFLNFIINFISFCRFKHALLFSFFKFFSQFPPLPFCTFCLIFQSPTFF